MKHRHAALVAAVLTSMAIAAPAADFTFSGNIQFQKDVVRVLFTLSQDATDVRVWTDSFLEGTNFDPITAVWSASTGELIGENDDDSGIAAGQTYYDSGLVFATLAAGSYVLTVAAYPNFARGSLLGNGFGLDDEAPISIADWCQPASDNCSNHKGTFWRANLSGVDAAAVPEPSGIAMLAAGLALVGACARRRAA